MAHPRESFDINGDELYLRLVALFAAKKDVSLFVSVEPEDLLRLGLLLDEGKETIIRSIHDGGLESYPMDEEIEGKLKRRLWPDKGRAKYLEAIVARTGRLRPGDVWPDEKVACCAMAGMMDDHTDAIRAEFGPQVTLREFGYVNNTHAFTYPLGNTSPECALWGDSAFVEFLHADEPTGELAETMTALQLVEGEIYRMVVTNSAGLYRFALDDEFRFTGFHKGSRF